MPRTRYPSDDRPRSPAAVQARDARRTDDNAARRRARAARKWAVGLGAARLATFQRRQAAALRRFPYVCPRCFEPCWDPLGHVNDDGCLTAHMNAARRDALARRVAHAAAILDHRQSPG